MAFNASHLHHLQVHHLHHHLQVHHTLMLGPDRRDLQHLSINSTWMQKHRGVPCVTVSSTCCAVHACLWKNAGANQLHQHSVH